MKTPNLTLLLVLAACGGTTDGSSLTTPDVVAHYEQQTMGRGPEFVWDEPETAPGDDLVRLQSARVVDEDSTAAATLDVRRPIGIEIGFRVLRHGKPVVPKLKIFDQHGAIVFNAMDTSSRWHEPMPPGEYVATAWIPENLLNEGRHAVDVSVVVSGDMAVPRECTGLGLLSIVGRTASIAIDQLLRASVQGLLAVGTKPGNKARMINAAPLIYYGNELPAGTPRPPCALSEAMFDPVFGDCLVRNGTEMGLAQPVPWKLQLEGGQQLRISALR